MKITLPNQDICTGCGLLKLVVSACGMCGAPAAAKTTDPLEYERQLVIYVDWERAGFPGEKQLSFGKRDQTVEVT